MNRIGVIVGRFQVPELHGAHKRLIDYTFQTNHQVVFILGERKDGTPDRRNPLSFRHRHEMLMHYILHNCDMSQLLDVRRLEDSEKDLGVDSIREWSYRLDHLLQQIVGDNTEENRIRLIGGRDSFISKYDGKYPTYQVSPARFHGCEQDSGTARRDNVRTYEHLPAFRAGYIQAVKDLIKDGM